MSSRLARVRRWLWLVVCAGFVLLIDQISKDAILASFAYGESRQPIAQLYPWFQLTYSRNTGSAFGVLPQASALFFVIALGIVVALVVYYHRLPASAVGVRFALALIIGGALGNALDRWQHGAVIDFIHYQIPGVVSNVSNLADHAIVVGVAIIFVTTWRKPAAPPAVQGDEKSGDQEAQPPAGR